MGIKGHMFSKIPMKSDLILKEIKQWKMNKPYEATPYKLDEQPVFSKPNVQKIRIKPIRIGGLATEMKKESSDITMSNL